VCTMGSTYLYPSAAAVLIPARKSWSAFRTNSMLTEIRYLAIEVVIGGSFFRNRARPSGSETRVDRVDASQGIEVLEYGILKRFALGQGLSKMH
jgi:hypothetical protein